jgi:predicted solute-binding protein
MRKSIQLQRLDLENYFTNCTLDFNSEDIRKMYDGINKISILKHYMSF